MNEGDVDGNGTDEWGYLYTWMSSQWRQYRIYTFDSRTWTWKHHYYGKLLSTPEYVRANGKEIVEKALARAGSRSIGANMTE